MNLFPYWEEVILKQYHPSEPKYLEYYSKGLTYYNTDIHCEGIAADGLFYPLGTRILVTYKESGLIMCKEFVVDDIIFDVVGRRDLMYIRFKHPVKNFVDGKQEVFVNNNGPRINQSPRRQWRKNVR